MYIHCKKNKNEAPSCLKDVLKCFIWKALEWIQTSSTQTFQFETENPLFLCTMQLFLIFKFISLSKKHWETNSQTTNRSSLVFLNMTTLRCNWLKESHFHLVQQFTPQWTLKPLRPYLYWSAVNVTWWSYWSGSDIHRANPVDNEHLLEIAKWQAD